MSRRESKSELADLIFAMINNSLDQDQLARLNDRLKNDPEDRKYYVEFMLVHSSLRGHSGVSTAAVSEPVFGPEEYNSILRVLAENEISAAPVEVERKKESPKTTCLQVTSTVPPKPVISKPSVIAVILSSAAILVISLIAWLVPADGPVVATLTDSVGAKWSNDTGLVEQGSELRCRLMVLDEGFAEITFLKGAKVVLQGPSEITLENEDMLHMWSGRLSAVVPESAIGFTVRTAQAMIVDYGTEFGVAAFSDGAVQTHVFQGEVKVRTSESDKDSLGKSLRAGQQGIVTKGQLDIIRLPDASNSFVRTLDEVRSECNYIGQNLIVNGDFEANKDVPMVDNSNINHMTHNVRIIGWQDEFLTTLLPYNDLSGPFFRNNKPGTVPIPTDCGKLFFCGIEAGIVWQEINVAGLAESIDTAQVRYDLSAWLGGWYDHKDSAVITVHFLDWTGFEVGKAKIGPLTVQERDTKLMFTKRTASGLVPVETRVIRLEIETFMDIGASDAYVDNLSLILNSVVTQ